MIPWGRNCHCPIVQMGKLRHGAVKTFVMGEVSELGLDLRVHWPQPQSWESGWTDRWVRCREPLAAGFWGSLVASLSLFSSFEMEASGPSIWT